MTFRVEDLPGAGLAAATRGRVLGVLGGMVLADLLFIGIYGIVLVLRFYERIADVPPPLDIQAPGSLASLYLYGKWVVAGGAMRLAWRRTGEGMFLALAAVLALLLLDDAGEIHERLGDGLVAPLGLVPVGGLGAGDVGELLVFGALALVCGAILLAGIATSGRLGWTVGLVFAALFALLALFGIAADALHAIVLSRGFDTDRLGHLMRLGLDVAEDGGELFVGSLICAFALDVWWRVSMRGRGGAA